MVKIDGYDKPFIVFKKETKHSRYFKDAEKLDTEAAYTILFELLNTKPQASASFLPGFEPQTLPTEVGALEEEEMEESEECEESADHTEALVVSLQSPELPLVSLASAPPFDPQLPPDAPLLAPISSTFDSTEGMFVSAPSSSSSDTIGSVVSSDAADPTEGLLFSKAKHKKKKASLLQEKCIKAANEALITMIDGFLDEQLIFWIDNIQKQKKTISKSLHGKVLFDAKQENRRIDNFIEAVTRKFAELRCAPNPAIKLSKSYGLLVSNNSQEALEDYKSTGEISEEQPVVPVSSLSAGAGFCHELSDPVIIDKRSHEETAATVSVPQALPPGYTVDILSDPREACLTTKGLNSAWMRVSGRSWSNDPVFRDPTSWEILERSMLMVFHERDIINAKLQSFILRHPNLKVISGLIFSERSLDMVLPANVQALMRYAVSLLDENVVIAPIYLADFGVWSLLELCKINGQPCAFYSSFHNDEFVSPFDRVSLLKEANEKVCRSTGMYGIKKFATLSFPQKAIFIRPEQYLPEAGAAIANLLLEKSKKEGYGYKSIDQFFKSAFKNFCMEQESACKDMFPYLVHYPKLKAEIPMTGIELVDPSDPGVAGGATLGAGRGTDALHSASSSSESAAHSGKQKKQSDDNQNYLPQEQVHHKQNYIPAGHGFLVEDQDERFDEKEELIHELAMLRLTGNEEHSEENLSVDQKTQLADIKKKVAEEFKYLECQIEMPKVTSKTIESVSLGQEGKVTFTKTELTIFGDEEQDLIPCLSEPEPTSDSSSTSLTIAKTPDNLPELEKPLDKRDYVPAGVVGIAVGSAGQIYPVGNVTAAAIEEACS